MIYIYDIYIYIIYIILYIYIFVIYTVYWLGPNFYGSKNPGKVPQESPGKLEKCHHSPYKSPSYVGIPAPWSIWVLHPLKNYY